MRSFSETAVKASPEEKKEVHCLAWSRMYHVDLEAEEIVKILTAERVLAKKVL